MRILYFHPWPLSPELHLRPPTPQLHLGSMCPRLHHGLSSHRLHRFPISLWLWLAQASPWFHLGNFLLPLTPLPSIPSPQPGSAFPPAPPLSSVTSSLPSPHLCLSPMSSQLHRYSPGLQCPPGSMSPQLARPCVPGPSTQTSTMAPLSCDSAMKDLADCGLGTCLAPPAPGYSRCLLHCLLLVPDLLLFHALTQSPSPPSQVDFVLSTVQGHPFWEGGVLSHSILVFSLFLYACLSSLISFHGSWLISSYSFSVSPLCYVSYVPYYVSFVFKPSAQCPMLFVCFYLCCGFLLVDLLSWTLLRHRVLYIIPTSNDDHILDPLTLPNT